MRHGFVKSVFFSRPKHLQGNFLGAVFLWTAANLNYPYYHILWTNFAREKCFMRSLKRRKPPNQSALERPTKPEILAVEKTRHSLTYDKTAQQIFCF